MRWDSGYRSSDVEDRRGMGPAGGGGGGLIVLLFWLFRMFGIPGVIIGLLIFGGMHYCGDGGRGLSGDGSAVDQAGDDELAGFVGFVLDDAQSTWTQQFAAKGSRYDKAKLVLFTGRVDSACGLASAAVGPFYCPRDRKVYIDLAFYRQLRARLGAPGDFAQAYVIAHEVGHHVQNLLGDLERGRGEGAGGGSVRVELQADCYAGVWAHDTNRRELLEAGDLEEAMRAAEAIGDDALQKAGQGTVQPESWTHGSSAQRMKWFRRGFETGRMDACDTFGANAL
jgi:predicted metalloprotease